MSHDPINLIGLHDFVILVLSQLLHSSLQTQFPRHVKLYICVFDPAMSVKHENVLTTYQILSAASALAWKVEFIIFHYAM